VNIESHTHTHKILNKISDNEVKYELAESKKVLENLLTKEIKSICYPEGKFNDSVIDKSKNNGYTKQYSSIPGFYYNELFLDVKKRSLVQFADENEFKAILKGGDHFLAFWYKLKHFIK
jgi:peptidoglycan/xylan/chitin deacetylase (PgdA/CDA1 family)